MLNINNYWKLKIKTIIICYYISTRISKLKKTNNSMYCQNMNPTECLYIADEMQNGTTNLENHLAVSDTVRHAFNMWANNPIHTYLPKDNGKHIFTQRLVN